MGDAVWIIHVAPLYNRASAYTKHARLRIYLAQRVGHLLFFADISRVEGDVVVSLDNVEYGDTVIARQECLDDMAPEKAAPAYDQVDIPRRGDHSAERWGQPWQPGGEQGYCKRELSRHAIVRAAQLV